MKGKPKEKNNRKVLNCGGYMNGKEFDKNKIAEEIKRQERFLTLCGTIS